MDIFIQLFENMERILSSYNLYLINMAETLKSVCLRIYSEYKGKAMDKRLKGVCLRFCLEDTVRFHKAQEKAIEYLLHLFLQANFHFQLLCSLRAFQSHVCVRCIYN